MKAVRTLVVVANDREARFLENEGVGKGLHQVQHLDREAVSGADIAYSAQRGRSHPGTGSARHAVEPPTPEDVQNRERFAHDLAALVAEALEKGGHDRLIVAAPPKMLGSLRAALPDSANARLAADLHKDLVHTPVADLAGHFTEIAAF